MLGLTEAELWDMTPRTFYNKLKGFNTMQEREELRHKELLFYILSPHVKQADRKKMQKDLFGSTVLKQNTGNPKPKHDPAKFWAEIDKRSAKKTENGKP